MRRTTWIVVATAVLLGGGARAQDAAPTAPAGPARDLLDDALSLAGLAREDLGWRPRGTWDRYPQDVPWALRHVGDLFDRPLSAVPWVRAMGAQARDLLSAQGLASKGPQGAGALMRLVHDLGVHRRYGAMRAYSANLVAERVPLDTALLDARTRAGRPTSIVTFGKVADFPRPVEDLRAAVASVPGPVALVLGRLVEDLLDAQAWAERAWRRVPLEQRVAVDRRLADVGVEETDALDYEPAFDDVARAWDEASLWYAGLKVVEALDRARADLATEVVAAGPARTRGVHVDVATPFGRLVVLGTGDDALDVGSEGAWLVVDLGGNDRYAGSVAASTPTRPVGALLDLGGDDVYEATDRAQGAGCLGVGVLLDVAGADRYRLAGTMGQGAGLFGLGVLADLGGDDEAFGAYSAQGCGYFGVGMLLDAAGADVRTLWSDGQGFGGVAGVGVLADGGGDDRYEAVVDAKVTGRPSYHTDGRVTVSNAQGCGMGRRGDGADGHSWGGGVGCLLDAAGDDRYEAANWCQGCGYWFGTGLLWDGGGNDAFRANGWAGGSGAHFCVGVLVDEAGNDLHRVAQNWGPGYGHDFTVGISCDLGGDDRYEAGEAGIGWSINRSVAILIDAAGDDAYVYDPPPVKPPPAGAPTPPPTVRRPGTAWFDARFVDRSGTTPLYWTESRSIGLFVDGGGTDRYPSGVADGDAWADAPTSDNGRARNVGVRLDRVGTIDLDRPQPR
ncbi:MAG: hypothetical protein IT460_07455 [Planctomycetes bacterium]|nr:hypothetical protein [Planctomycetota bacterium]